MADRRPLCLNDAGLPEELSGGDQVPSDVLPDAPAALQNEWSAGGFLPTTDPDDYYRVAVANDNSEFIGKPSSSFIVNDLLPAADAATARAILGAAPLVSPAFTGTPTAPTAASATNTTQLATTAFVQTVVSAAVAGLLELKGTTNASANPNYPAASKGDAYFISAAGRVGGASGKSVDVGDMVLATADNAGGTEASVGTSWAVLEHNLAGALLSANNLSDVANAETARSNLGLAIGTNVQAFDQTLQALAGANWAANSLAIGSGTDTVAQVTFAANTFPARASTGNLVAKTISDDALAFLSAANDGAMRTELGLGTAAVKNTGTSGDAVPLLNAASNTWSGAQTSTGWFATSAGGIACRVQPNDSDGVAYIGTSSAHALSFLQAGNARGSLSASAITWSGIAEVNTSILSPPTLAANTDNYAPTGHAAARTLRLSASSSINLTGLQGGTDGRRITISNVGSFNIAITHDATSTAANRFLCPNSVTLTLHPNDSVDCWYDGTSLRWRVIGI